MRIDRAEQQLSAAEQAGRAGTHGNERLLLAHALYELVQGGYVVGEAAEGVLQRVREHAHKALTGSAGAQGAPAAVLLARACLALRDTKQAEQALERAEQIGVSDAEVAPL